MIRGEKVERVASLAYLAGVDPIYFGEIVIDVIAEQSGLTCQHCRTLLARQVLAALLDAGWTMPGQGLDQFTTAPEDRT